MSILNGAAILVRICGCFMILAGSVWMGFHLCRQLEEQIIIIQQWRQVLIHLNSEIQYMRNPLPQALILAGNRCGDTVAQTLEKIAGKLTGETGTALEQLWAEQMAMDWDGRLPKDILRELTGLGSQLGQLDVCVQSQALLLAEKRLEAWEKRQREEENRKKRLYRAVSILSGVAVVIAFF